MLSDGAGAAERRCAPRARRCPLRWHRGAGCTPQSRRAPVRTHARHARRGGEASAGLGGVRGEGHCPTGAESGVGQAGLGLCLGLAELRLQREERGDARLTAAARDATTVVTAGAVITAASAASTSERLGGLWPRAAHRSARRKCLGPWGRRRRLCRAPLCSLERRRRADGAGLCGAQSAATVASWPTAWPRRQRRSGESSSRASVLGARTLTAPQGGGREHLLCPARLGWWRQRRWRRPAERVARGRPRGGGGRLLAALCRQSTELRRLAANG